MPATPPRLLSCLPWSWLRHLAPVSLALTLALTPAGGAGAAPAPPGRAAPAAGAPQPGIRIVAVVNGDVISNVDVDDRVRLFALSTGQPLNPDVLDRLRPQIRRQMVDERHRAGRPQGFGLREEHVHLVLDDAMPPHPAPDMSACYRPLLLQIN